LNLNFLWTFVSVVEEGNYSRAAKGLHLSQPAVSMQMQSLAQELGVELFRRSGHRVETTEAGAMLYEQEQERGITIELGFAWFDLPDGRRAGIIDVPGHERFVRNMLAGAAGIDIVLLVVAADEGVMPQTREHMAILELLGVETGIVVITKIDLVDPEMLELAEEDIADSLEGSFLEKVPRVPISVVTGQGLDQLKSPASPYPVRTQGQP